ncbi:MAG: hypothetical protein IT290_12825 [Deltaproteobacteria bacterium]|nr:hypothetical protein [Deltaproteobacteria bacterium]
MMNLRFALLALVLSILPIASSSAQSNSINVLPRRSVDMARFGLNAFVNDPRYGTVRSQLRTACGTLGVRHLRVLFQWNDQVQPTPSAPIDFSFYDDIARNIPRGCTALVVVAGLPSWMSNESNWIGGSARSTFVEKWWRKVLERYGANRRLSAWQLWNEPNDENNPHNTVLGVLSPAAYVELGALADNVRDEVAPTRSLVMAATTAINQNFPAAYNYNRDLLELGATAFFDVWAVHYYGVQLERLLLGGIDQFLQTVGIPIWMTESGEKGASRQLNYVRRLWPFLRQRVPGIARMYYYSFTEDTSETNSYAILNKNLRRSESDLYRHLVSLKGK